MAGVLREAGDQKTSRCESRSWSGDVRVMCFEDRGVPTSQGIQVAVGR